MPTTTLQVWPTADGKRWRCTCPFPTHDGSRTPKAPVIIREDFADRAYILMKQHVELEHHWEVIGVQVLSGVAP